MKTVGTHLVSLMTAESQLRHQMRPFIWYILVLTGFVLLYGFLFHVIMAWEGQDHSWFTGVYWALTVMSTLGFGDITFETDLGRMFSTVVLVTGIVLLLVILPFLFIRLVYGPWLEQRARARARAPRNGRFPGRAGYQWSARRSTWTACRARPGGTVSPRARPGQA